MKLINWKKTTKEKTGLIRKSFLPVFPLFNFIDIFEGFPDDNFDMPGNEFFYHSVRLTGLSRSIIPIVIIFINLDFTHFKNERCLFCER
ncbi:MAG: hypothetical protein AB1650_00330 [Candidatus Omnitrophota bacterium]